MKKTIVNHISTIKIALTSLFFVAMTFNLAMIGTSSTSHGGSGLSLHHLETMAFGSGEGGGGACDDDYDCPDGTYCGGPICLNDQCQTSSDCENNHTCSYGHCVGGGACTSDSDCSYGQLCRYAQCVGSGGTIGQGCSVNDDCAFDEFCYQYQCVQEGPPCYNNDDCPYGRECQPVPGEYYKQCVPS